MKLLKTVILFVLTILISGCEKYTINPGEGLNEETESYTKAAKSSSKGMQYKATGFIEIVWKGGEKGGDKGNKPEELLTFLDLSAMKKNTNFQAKGEITYLVLGTDRSPHREIKAEVCEIKTEGSKACIIGRVIFDSKGCSGGGAAGHDSGCDSGGGCSDDGEHDDGCGDDHTSDDGGCGDDHHTDDGGCGDDPTSDDGGCSDGTDHIGMGGPVGMGGPSGDKGNPMSGKNCRIDQMIALKLHDLGTPGTNGDKISWKWFSQETVPGLEALFIKKGNPGAIHLCQKTIIGGNLVVH